MPQWEIEKVYVPFNSVRRDEESSISYTPEWGEDADQAWLEAATVARAGWEMIAAIPVVGGHEFDVPMMMQSRGGGSSLTVGVYLIFKRPITSSPS